MSTVNAAGPLDLWTPVKLRSGLFSSLFGIWYRHARVYCQTLAANATPPILEPLFFFTAITLGLGGYMRPEQFDGLSYRMFVASGLVVSSPMFTAVFETTFGTFVRLTYQKTYDAMLGTHLRLGEIFVGELLFVASKGVVYSTIVLGITMAFGVRPPLWCLLVPPIGAVTGYLFGAIGLIVTSYVKTINNFSFFLSGVITPLFFFSGTFFPIRGHHWIIDRPSDLLPLAHPIELSRALFRGQFTLAFVGHLVGLGVWVAVAHVIALRRMRRRVFGK
jgi:lipooligosaccharide transport system permease protein